MGGLTNAGRRDVGKITPINGINVPTKLIEEHTRFGNEGETARVDLLVFSEEPLMIENLKVDCSIAKSDHAIVEFEVLEKRAIGRKEDHKIIYCEK